MLGAGGAAVHFVSARHEQIAAHAADGYARATGKAGVLLTHLGPGLTNAATGVANAALDSIPMVVIAGDVQPLLRPTSAPGSQPACRCRPVPDLPSVLKRVYRVDKPELFPEIHRRRSISPKADGPGRCCGRADGRVLGNDRSSAVREARRYTRDSHQPTIDVETASAHRARTGRGRAPAALRGRRRAVAKPRGAARASSITSDFLWRTA